MNSLRFITLAIFVVFFSNLETKAQGNTCNGAFQIKSVSNYCSSPAQFTNAGSTQDAPVASCWASSATGDVYFWFTATAPDLTITVAGGAAGTIKQPYIELIVDNCAGISLGCSGPKKAGSDTSILSIGGLIPQTDYIIRVASAPANRGSFKLCVKNYTAPLNPGADCDGAIRLCDMSKITLPALSGGGKNNK